MGTRGDRIGVRDAQVIAGSHTGKGHTGYSRFTHGVKMSHGRELSHCVATPQRPSRNCAGGDVRSPPSQIVLLVKYAAHRAAYSTGGGVPAPLVESPAFGNDPSPFELISGLTTRASTHWIRSGRCGSKLGACGSKLGTRKSKLGVCESKPGTCGSKLGASGSKLGT
eukprot:366120-Chlamydomonas_euryale.AAC.2